MTSTTSRALRRSLQALAAATLFAACADGAPVAPDPSGLAAHSRLPELGSCQNLQVPAGSKLSFHAYAVGVQIYTWTGTAWRFDGPSADLYAHAGSNGLIGTHFAGPTWHTVSGSRVVGTVSARCTASPDAIDWLRLDAVADGQGVFEHTSFILRLNTVGGKAPTAPGSFVGEEVRVPYTADYYFYRAP